jgi:hypothetical protein
LAAARAVDPLRAALLVPTCDACIAEDMAAAQHLARPSFFDLCEIFVANFAINIVDGGGREVAIGGHKRTNLVRGSGDTRAVRDR